jgi:hypothetical protein
VPGSCYCGAAIDTTVMWSCSVGNSFLMFCNDCSACAMRASKGTTLLWNIRNHSPKDTALHPRRLKISKMECIYCDVGTKILCIRGSTAVVLQTTKFSNQERSQASSSVAGRLNKHFKWKEQAGSEQSMLRHAASYVRWVLTLMVDRSIGYFTYRQLCS